MDDDHRELTNRLFATATGMLEDATEVAVAGQSPRLSASHLADHGRRIQAAAQDVAIIAEARTRCMDVGTGGGLDALRFALEAPRICSASSDAISPTE